jgi:flagellar biosynthesis/type III secretory pathway M-ring protein FliF/YscJ
MNSTIAAQSAQISTLNSSLNNATNIGYAGVGIAIIALIAAVVLGMRKK